MKNLKSITSLILTFIVLCGLVPSANAALSTWSQITGGIESIHSGGVTGRVVGVNSAKVTYVLNSSQTAWTKIAGHSSLSVAQGKNLKFKRAVIRTSAPHGSNDYEVYGIGNVGTVYRKLGTGAWSAITTSPKMDDLEIGTDHLFGELVKMDIFIKELICKLQAQFGL